MRGHQNPRPVGLPDRQVYNICQRFSTHGIQYNFFRGGSLQRLLVSQVNHA